MVSLDQVAKEFNEKLDQMKKTDPVQYRQLLSEFSDLLLEMDKELKVALAHR